VAELSRRLKAISKDYKLPILLLAQLNRESEKENRAPRMSDLRESGAIEQDSDRILFLHRDAPDQQSRVILTQAKLRSGPCMVSRVCTLAGAIYRLTPE
jgi:replicative DNA helicase